MWPRPRSWTQQSNFWRNSMVNTRETEVICEHACVTKRAHKRDFAAEQRPCLLFAGKKSLVALYQILALVAGSQLPVATGALAQVPEHSDVRNAVHFALQCNSTIGTID